MRPHRGRAVGFGMVVALVNILMLSSSVEAQVEVMPPSITVEGGPVCSAGSQDFPVQIRLPIGPTFTKVDVFMLFDDTGSFAGEAPRIIAIFPQLVAALEAALPDVEFGFGVGRFEDYGGPGSGFSGESLNGRPFVLNQPIVTAATAGGSAARDALITAALARSAPGFGGDGPESAIAEALFQTATGGGFDGNGNGSSLDSGPACATTTQTNPGNSGDVPPFSSCAALPQSGTLGGAGFRAGVNVLRLVILATDICAVAAFPSGSPIPPTVTGGGGSSEPTSALACSTIPGVGRFGFVSDSKTPPGTVLNAVAPLGAGTVQATVSALNALGIRVMGMGPGAAPTTSSGPSFDESVWLSAIARLTGAVDETGTPLVFSTAVPVTTLRDAIVNAIVTTATRPLDITLDHTTLPAGLSFAFTPPQVDDVGPGEIAAFTVTLTGDGSPIAGSFDIQFKDVASDAVLGEIPVSITCGDLGGPDNGTGDPLGLIAFAAIQPFWSSGDNFTVIEITSPVSDNAKPQSLHAIFFDATCARDQSIPLPVTQNGVLLFTPDDIGIAYNGLAAIARTNNDITLSPVDAAIHVRGHWVNFANDHIRVLDPISVAAAESSPTQTYNPLRSGVDFTNPLEGSTFHTTIILVCPSPTVTGALPAKDAFPAPPRIAFGTTGATSGIVGVIYDDDETPLRNIHVPCVCITPLPVLTINRVYEDATKSGSGLFYTELFTLPVPASDTTSAQPPAAFTGYRSIVVSDAAVWPGGQGDKFGRLNNASSSALRGTIPAIPER